MILIKDFLKTLLEQRIKDESITSPVQDTPDSNTGNLVTIGVRKCDNPPSSKFSFPPVFGPSNLSVANNTIIESPYCKSTQYKLRTHHT